MRRILNSADHINRFSYGGVFVGKIKLAIIEDNKELCEILVSYINDNFPEMFEIAGVAHDGSSGLQLITESMPNIVLIDIVLPILDGIGVLERLQNLHLTEQICCVMLTAVSQDDVTRRAVELGAKYYFLKPFDQEELVYRLIEIYNMNMEKMGYRQDKPETDDGVTYHRRAADNNPEVFATSILQKIGIPANLTGYYYLRLALVRCINDRSLLSGLTKVLYPMIAKDFKTTGQRVERSIRHSIEKAWGANCADVYYKMLGRETPAQKSKPSNGVFIMDIVDYYVINFRARN
jgi:two-component system response regulator (stage 0 sporulation protein A)